MAYLESLSLSFLEPEPFLLPEVPDSLSFLVDLDLELDDFEDDFFVSLVEEPIAMVWKRGVLDNYRVFDWVSVQGVSWFVLTSRLRDTRRGYIYLGNPSNDK